MEDWRKRASALGVMAAKAYYIKHNAELRQQYYAQPKLCAFCNEVIPYEKRFNTYCNSACGARKNKNRQNTGKRRSHKCEFCHNTTKSKYCSLKCFHGAAWHKRKQKIIHDGFAENSFMARKFLLERDGHKCMRCGNSEWQGKPIVLTMHHINGLGHDNRMENCQILCWNCHAQTSTFGGRNAGHGSRSSRRKYYVSSQQLKLLAQIEKQAGGDSNSPLETIGP